MMQSVSAEPHPVGLAHYSQLDAPGCVEQARQLNSEKICVPGLLPSALKGLGGQGLMGWDDLVMMQPECAFLCLSQHSDESSLGPLLDLIRKNVHQGPN